MMATDAPNLPLVIGLPFLCMFVIGLGITVVWFVTGRGIRS
jgi:hypothetical protein